MSKAEELAEQLEYMALIADAGRPPEPRDARRKAAALMRQQEAVIKQMVEALQTCSIYACAGGDGATKQKHLAAIAAAKEVLK